MKREEIEAIEKRTPQFIFKEGDRVVYSYEATQALGEYLFKPSPGVEAVGTVTKSEKYHTSVLWDGKTEEDGYASSFLQLKPLTEHERRHELLTTIKTKTTMSTDTAEAPAKTEEQIQTRRHYVTYKLKKDGITTDAEAKTISVPEEMQDKLSDNQQKWIDELKAMGFALQLQLPEKKVAEEDLQSDKNVSKTINHLTTPIMENKPTNFFTEIFPHTEHCDIRLVIGRDGDKISVSMLPQTKKDNEPFRITPLHIAGTEDELNEGFFGEIGKAFGALQEAGLKSNANAFADSVKAARPAKEKAASKPSSAKAPTAAKPATKSPDQKRDAKKKAVPKKTIKQQVEEALNKKEFDKARTIVQKADKGGGLPKDQVEELVKLVDKAVDASYYTADEQKQIQTRIDSLKTELEAEEKGLLTLTEAQPANKQYANMLKAPQAKLKKLNIAIGQFQLKKLGLNKNKKPMAIAQLLKNIIN